MDPDIAGALAPFAALPPEDLAWMAEELAGWRRYYLATVLRPIGDQWPAEALLGGQWLEDGCW